MTSFLSQPVSIEAVEIKIYITDKWGCYQAASVITVFSNILAIYLKLVKRFVVPRLPYFWVIGIAEFKIWMVDTTWGIKFSIQNFWDGIYKFFAWWQGFGTGLFTGILITALLLTFLYMKKHKK